MEKDVLLRERELVGCTLLRFYGPGSIAVIVLCLQSGYETTIMTCRASVLGVRGVTRWVQVSERLITCLVMTPILLAFVRIQYEGLFAFMLSSKICYIDYGEPVPSTCL